MRLIDADELIEVMVRSDCSTKEKICNIIENRPTERDCYDDRNMKFARCIYDIYLAFKRVGFPHNDSVRLVQAVIMANKDK